MKIMIESTDNTAMVNDTPVRVWKGRTARGYECVVFVALIGAPENEHLAEFQAELREMQVVMPTAGLPC